MPADRLQVSTLFVLKFLHWEVGTDRIDPHSRCHPRPAPSTCYETIATTHWGDIVPQIEVLTMDSWQGDTSHYGALSRDGK